MLRMKSKDRYGRRNCNKRKNPSKAIQAEGEALDALHDQYFERRVFTALGVMSPRWVEAELLNADSMEAQAHDTVRHIQRTLSIFIKLYHQRVVGKKASIQSK